MTEDMVFSNSCEVWILWFFAKCDITRTCNFHSR